MISKQRIRAILDEGRRLDSRIYVRHCGLNHVKTFLLLL